MPKKKKNFTAKTADASWQKEVKKLCQNLYYISETDSPVEFFSGEKTETVNAKTVAAEAVTNKNSEIPVAETNLTDFFGRLTKTEDWFGEEEKESAAKFSRIQQLLEKNLSEIKVFKIGQIELDIYVAGLDAEKFLSGIRTKAVET